MKAYSSIQITDITDVKKLNSYLTSNQPNAVIYDPNQNTYSPNWSTTALVLTPVIFLNNDAVSLTDSCIKISWQRQLGSNSPTSLVTGETVTDGILTVSNNMLSSVTSGIITYICTIDYTDPDTQAKVQNKSQMSYTLIRNASELSDCTINGEGAFLYKGDGSLASSKSITISATLTNCSINQWQYKASDGTWNKYPNSTVSTSLTINATDNVFVNDMATIRCLTSISDVYDIHQIVKIRDGAAGNNTITAVLSNDSQSVPCTSNGALYSTSLTDCSTTISIYNGTQNDTSNWTITATPSSGVTGTYDSKTYTYKVTGITVESGYVEFICSRSGYSAITKRFNINKDRNGSDGNDAVIYTLSTDVAVMKLNASNVFSPSSATFSAFKRVGNATASSAYSGRFKIYETTDNSTYTLKYTSTSDEVSKAYTPSSASVKAIKGELYATGGTSTLLDTQILSVVTDGKDGKEGQSGKDAINVVLGNSSEIIPCNEDGYAKSAKTITIPYSCYKGVTRVAGTAKVGTLPTGVTLSSNTDATASADGTIILAVASGASLSNTSLSGDITITFTVSGLTSTHKFNWSKSLQSASAVLLQTYAPNGNVLSNGTGSVVLNSILTYGNENVTSGVTYQWSKYVGTSYTNLSGKTASSLTVTGDMVDSLASFRLSATYKSKTYYSYITVIDKQDPISVECFSTLGTQIKNGVGIGAIYALAFRNGVEIDAIKTTTFSTTAPTGSSSGNYYYKLDSANKTVTLMKYDGSKWVEASSSDNPTGTYKWYRRNGKGEILDTSTPYKTGKVIYLDGTIVDGQVNFTCEVDID